MPRLPFRMSVSLHGWALQSLHAMLVAVEEAVVSFAPVRLLSHSCDSAFPGRRPVVGQKRSASQAIVHESNAATKGARRFPLLPRSPVPVGCESHSYSYQLLLVFPFRLTC